MAIGTLGQPDFTVDGIGMYYEGDTRFGANPTLKVLQSWIDCAASAGAASTLTYGKTTTGYTPGASRKFVPLIFQMDVATVYTGDGVGVFESSNDVGKSSATAPTVVSTFGSNECSLATGSTGVHSAPMIGSDFVITTGNYCTVEAFGTTLQAGLRIYGYEVDA